MLQRKLKVLKAQLNGGKTKGKGGKKWVPAQSFMDDVDWQDDRTSKKANFASGLLPEWNSEASSIKEPVKNQTHVQISAGGLNDSDAEAVNPFPSPSKTGPSTLTEEELTKGTQKSKQDRSCRNEASITLSSLKNLKQIE